MRPIFLDATIDTTNHFTVSDSLVRVGVVALAISLIFVFGRTLLSWIGKFTTKTRLSIGKRMVDVNFRFQRYVYLHSHSPLSKLYNWVNVQLIASNLKRNGITPTGYIMFWALLSCIVSLLCQIVLGAGMGWGIFIIIAFFAASMILTRVAISSSIETREIAIMDAIDLIVPEIGNGVKNAIAQYKDNFSPLVRQEFLDFLTNVQDRGYSFKDSMMMLADNLGPVFRDFAQKAIYFEASGEKMQEVFSDITETNRLRRQIREENDATFAGLKMQFVISAAMCGGYFCFLMITDDYSRNFFLNETFGNILLVIILVVVFLVLSYITTIKSRAL